MSHTRTVLSSRVLTAVADTDDDKAAMAKIAERRQAYIAARNDANKLKSGEAVISTIDAYLVHRLTGGKVFATDFTNASRTLLFGPSTILYGITAWAFFTSSEK